MRVEEEIKLRAVLISDDLIKGRSIFMNIDVPEEWSQYDVWFSYDFQNYGIHQRGIRSSDLLIGIIGFGCSGFDVEKLATTEVGYYKEKLNIYSEYLTKLFNEVRNLIYEHNQKNLEKSQ